MLATDINPDDKKITRATDGTITIPSAAFTKPAGSTRDVLVMRSFDGGQQIYLARFARQGQIGKYEVTQAQYQVIMGTNPSRSSKGPEFPVDNVGESNPSP